MDKKVFKIFTLEAEKYEKKRTTIGIHIFLNIYSKKYDNILRTANSYLFIFKC